MMETVFVYVVPSALTVLVIANIIIWAVAPKSAKLLIKKKLGLLQNKTLNLIADNDYYMSLEAMDVAPEGLLELRRKKKLSKYFYLAKPNEVTPNKEESSLLRRVDVDRSPPYNLDGIPTYLSHIADAYATNPRVILSLQLAEKINSKKPKEMDGELALSHYFRKVGEKIVQTVPIKILLGFDPAAIAKVGLKVPQTRINQTQRRYEERGVIKSKALGGDMFKLMIVGAIVAVAIIAGAVVALHLIGA